jgi:myo-inositol-hexaphosphate 3-phosphohydrolase
VEGLALYTTSRGRGDLIAASQGNSQFVISQRAGSNAYVLPFTGVAAGGRDPVTHPDGSDVTSQALGAAFAQSVFVAHDHQDDRDHQNFQRGPGPALAPALPPPPHTKPEPLPSRRTRAGSFHLSPRYHLCLRNHPF